MLAWPLLLSPLLLLLNSLLILRCPLLLLRCAWLSLRLVAPLLGFGSAWLSLRLVAPLLRFGSAWLHGARGRIVCRHHACAGEYAGTGGGCDRRVTVVFADAQRRITASRFDLLPLCGHRFEVGAVCDRELGGRG